MGRGEVVLTPFPYSDLQGLKRRPAMLLVIERRLIGSTLGMLVEADLAQVDDALRDVFGLS